MKAGDSASIQRMFNTIAKRYDRGNAIISLGLYKLWLNRLLKDVLLRKQPNHLVDFCAGTGEVAFSYLQKRAVSARATLIDFSKEMLEVAKRKADPLYDVDYICSDVLQTPLQDNSADLVTIAYGIRNVVDVELCASEARRLLKPNGTFAVLELTRPRNRLMQLGHEFYLRNLMPRLAHLAIGGEGAYDYLSETVQTFMDADELSERLRSAGFTSVEATSLHSGIATLMVASS